jgi:hypothetical protein
MDAIKPITPLPIPTAPQKLKSNTIHTGLRYRFECQDLSVFHSVHGVCGDYRISAERGDIQSVAATPANNNVTECYFWDTDVDLSRLTCDVWQNTSNGPQPLKDYHLKSNRLMMQKTELEGPQIISREENALLTLSPRFDFTFYTDSYAAQLGVINLVQATRFITLDNGNKVPLLDTDNEESAVLYLENPSDDQAIKLVSTPQEISVARQHTYTCTISQHIPAIFNGESVASVTVLEQYWSYLMQRALPGDNNHNTHDIWIPVYSPVSWGWSIRVGHRTDGEWGILRRKLILPTTGHDGLQLPAWNKNTVDCATLAG